MRPRSFRQVSPARNRVTPLGDIVAISLRGVWTGNRGITGAGTRPLPCERPLDHLRVEFRGRWHEQWQPHHFTWPYSTTRRSHSPPVIVLCQCRRDAYNAHRSPGRTLGGAGLQPRRSTAASTASGSSGEPIGAGCTNRSGPTCPTARSSPDGTPALVLGGELSSGGHTTATASTDAGRSAAPLPSSPRPSPPCAPAIGLRSTAAGDVENRPSLRPA